jgi:hypothetical protein
MGELADTCNDAGAGRRAGGVTAVELFKGFAGSAAAAAAVEVAMTKHRIPDGEDGQEPFAEILAVMDTEQLIRFRHRLGKIGRKRMVKILSEEIAEREKAP